MIGERYTRLVVIEFSHKDAKSRKWWKCRCDCGEMRTLHTGNLRSGNTRSCGCLAKDSAAQRRLSIHHSDITAVILGYKRHALRLMEKCGRGKWRPTEYGESFVNTAATKQQAMEWRPIETAPRDTELLVYNERTKRTVVGFVYEFTEATHWMPLPALPGKTEVAVEGVVNERSAKTVVRRSRCATTERAKGELGNAKGMKPPNT